MLVVIMRCFILFCLPVAGLVTQLNSAVTETMIQQFLASVLEGPNIHAGFVVT
jgi:hypothetical protein